MKHASHRRRSQAIFRPFLESLESRLTPTTFTVSSLADSGAGSLRAAIASVNSDTTADVIDFSVAGVIQLTSGALPAITNVVTIDGTSAPGFTDAPVVEIDNNGFAGLTLTASSSSLKSLSIVNANGAGVTLHGVTTNSSATGASMAIRGNFIGLALDGSVAPNTGAGLVVDDSRFDTIGGGSSIDRNVISGNGGDGIQIGPSGGQTNLDTFIISNFIGTDPTGQAPAPNQGNGITVLAEGNEIGDFTGSFGNTIAFNGQAGVEVDGGAFNVIQSNSIFGNAGPGIQLVNNGNQGQIAPQLSYVMEVPGSTPGTVNVQVGGILNGQTFLPFTVQVFATLNGVPAGQGQLFLGYVQVRPSTNGFATFTLSASVPNGAGATFTATAADTTPDFNSFSNTSVFSNSLGASTPNQVYVANVYQLLLSRAPDASSSVWVNALNNGVSAATFVLSIEHSTEYLNGQVSSLYNSYLGRNPEPAGAQAWTNFLQTGGTLEQVAAAITGSDEYFQLAGGTNQGFVFGLYTEVLHRTSAVSEGGELAGWIAALDNGTPRTAVAGAFLTSLEYRANRIVQPDYMTFLLRPADDGGVAAWVNALNAGATDQQVLSQIFGSAEGYAIWS